MTEVELDAFSGRPNPRWVLTPAEATEFFSLLGRLRPDSRDARVPDQLGYRGFVVRADREEIRVFRETVFTRQGVVADPGRALERVLLDSARAHVSEAVLRAIERE